MHLDAELILRDGAAPSRPVALHRRRRSAGSRWRERGSERHVGVPGKMDRDVAADIEEAIWEKLHFATHLRADRLGEFTIGTDLHRSESLALVQLLILYHLVTAKATIALGGVGVRADAAVPAAERMEPAGVKS